MGSYIYVNRDGRLELSPDKRWDSEVVQIGFADDDVVMPILKKISLRIGNRFYVPGCDVDDDVEALSAVESFCGALKREFEAIGYNPPLPLSNGMMLR